jgi:hypothetical protein
MAATRRASLTVTVCFLGLFLPVDALAEPQTRPPTGRLTWSAHAAPAMWLEGKLSCAETSESSGYSELSCSRLTFLGIEAGAGASARYLRIRADGAFGASSESRRISYSVLAFDAAPSVLLPLGRITLSAGARLGMIARLDSLQSGGSTAANLGLMAGMEAALELHLGRLFSLEPTGSVMLTPLGHPKADEAWSRDHGTTWWMLFGLRLRFNFLGRTNE